MNKTDFNILLHEYASLIAKFGLNIKKGEMVEITLPVDCLEFNYIFVEELYKAGCSRVFSHLHDSYMDRIHYMYGDKNELSKFYDYKMEKLKFFRNQHVNSAMALSPNFDALEGVNPDVVSEIKLAKREKYYIFHSALKTDFKWTCFGIPNKSWAHKIFPDLPIDKAMEKLWIAIFKTCRVEKGKTLTNWINHDNDLKKRANYLTSLKIKSLHYTSKNGTDLTVGIIPNTKFIGGRHNLNKSISFNPNFPTEEVFTTPNKYETNGIVYASKPLVIQSTLIEGISMRFENGRIVEVDAKKNKNKLLSVLKSDENAHYLGEIALVPYDSPINNTNLLFFETLYDENASCHLAFGTGFPFVINDFDEKKYNSKELEEIGCNESKVHVDFMVGTKDLNIEATTISGKKIRIFKNGNWVK